MSEEESDDRKIFLKNRIRHYLKLEILAVLIMLGIDFVLFVVFGGILPIFFGTMAMVWFLMVSIVSFFGGIAIIYKVISMLEKRRQEFKKDLEGSFPEEKSLKTKCSFLGALSRLFQEFDESTEMSRKLAGKDVSEEQRLRYYYENQFGKLFLANDGYAAGSAANVIVLNILGFPPTLVVIFFIHVLHAPLDISTIFIGIATSILTFFGVEIALAFFLFWREYRRHGRYPFPPKNLIEKNSSSQFYSVLVLMPWCFFFAYFPTNFIEFLLWVASFSVFFVHDGIEAFLAAKFAKAAKQLYTLNYSADLTRSKRAIAGIYMLGIIITLMPIIREWGLYPIPLVFLFYCRPPVEKMLFRNASSREEIHHRWAKLEFYQYKYFWVPSIVFELIFYILACVFWTVNDLYLHLPIPVLRVPMTWLYFILR
ncbi:MAG: hypothetical protein ACXQS8_03860 [Candidatus Helarchaeales archaeon]